MLNTVEGLILLYATCLKTNNALFPFLLDVSPIEYVVSGTSKLSKTFM